VLAAFDLDGIERQSYSERMGLDDALEEIRKNRADIDTACKRFAELAKEMKLPENGNAKYGRKGWEITGLKVFGILVFKDGQWATAKDGSHPALSSLDYEKHIVPDARVVERRMAEILDRHSH